jgi:outer membrane cobalamin receptor
MSHLVKAALIRPLQTFTLFCLASSGWTQERQAESLDEIVVMATRMESSVRDVARSVSVVNKDRIQGATQQLGLDEALAYSESL